MLRCVGASGCDPICQANSRYCSAESEILFDAPAPIKEVADDGAIPDSGAVANVRRLADVEGMCVGDVGNFAAVVADADAVGDVSLKSGGSTSRRKVTLLDDSGVTVELTVWGVLAQQCWTQGSVVVLKGVKASDWAGRSLNTMSTTTMVVAPSGVPVRGRAGELGAWYAMHGGGALGCARSLTAKSISREVSLCISDVLAAGQALAAPGGGRREDGVRGVMLAVVEHATVSCVAGQGKGVYDACAFGGGDGSSRSCGRKAEWRGDGRGWVCSAGHTCADAEKRWVVLLEIVDHSGSMQVTAFDDVARAILGCRFWFFQFSSFLLCSVWGCFGVVIG